MVKTQSLKHVLCLVCSLILNVFFLFKVGGEWNLSWSKKAATEAEAVAAISCSGHGRAYLDGLVLDGNKGPVCECNTCYGGPDCSQFYPDCAANADGYLTPLALSTTRGTYTPKRKLFLVKFGSWCCIDFKYIFLPVI